MLLLKKMARTALFFAAVFPLTAAPFAARAADSSPASPSASASVTTPVTPVITPPPAPVPPTVVPDQNAGLPAAASPGGTTNPVITNLVDPGTKTYYLGDRSGLDGWLLMKDGQMQIAYATPDKKTIVIGAMFGADGYNVTHEQVQAIARANREVAVFLQDTVKKQAEAAAAAGNNPSSFQQEEQNEKPASPGLTSMFPPSERLLNDLQQATGVDVGDPHAPTLYMVMDPNCPHCQAAWKTLRQAVMDKKLHIHLVPIGRNDEDERAASRLLLAKDPLEAWDKYVSGDKTQLAGDADPKMLLGVQSNHVLTDKWSITETPYLLYRGKDGKIKVLEGEPKDPAGLPGDIEQID